MLTRLKKRCVLKEAHGGEVVVVSAGPERVSSTIREALAKGCRSRHSHPSRRTHRCGPAAGRCKTIAEALKEESPDLVLTGLQSDDFGYGQTGVILAELLGLPHATIIMNVEVTPGGSEAEARTGERLLSACGDPAARAAHHSIGQQQIAVRHADGD